jgi:cytochrome c553
MKTVKLAILVVTIALMLFIMLPSLSWAAEDGAAIYKAKCAACHGADGAGKAAAKIPALNTPELAKKDGAKIADELAKSPKHATLKSLPAEQLKAAIAFSKTLAKK